MIQEGTCPKAIAPFLQTMLDFMPGKIEPKNDGLLERAQAGVAAFGSRLFGPYFKEGAIEKTQIFLVMSHDSESALSSDRQLRRPCPRCIHC